jgi:hypothetical protein
MSGGQQSALEEQLPHVPLMHAWLPQSLHVPHAGGVLPPLLLELVAPPLLLELVAPPLLLELVPPPLLLELVPPPGGGQFEPTVTTPSS